ncbi:MAG: hypothetical protein GF398_19155 [Chitinivibrionales bacterium]|nr:hypothetical protein [Chitinivibrionales bacterium]
MTLAKKIIGIGAVGAAVTGVVGFLSGLIRKKESPYVKFGRDIDNVVVNAVKRIERAARRIKHQASNGKAESVAREVDKAVDEARSDLDRISGEMKNKLEAPAPSY